MSKLIKMVKQHLCSSSNPHSNNKDYEYIGYNPNNNDTTLVEQNNYNRHQFPTSTQTNDNFNNNSDNETEYELYNFKNRVKILTKLTSTNPKTMRRQQIAQTDLKASESVLDETIDSPQWESTKLNNNKTQYTNETTTFTTNYLIDRPSTLYTKNRLTSTMIHPSLNQVSTISDDTSVECVYDDSTYYSSDYSSDSSDESSYSLMNLSQLQPPSRFITNSTPAPRPITNKSSPKPIYRDQIYVCSIAYNKQLEGDLSIDFSQRLRLLHCDGQLALVQVITTGDIGYIPFHCISTLTDFLQDLKKLNI
jgi:hypothetical protein